jgi:hypothetical protein
VATAIISSYVQPLIPLGIDAWKTGKPRLTSRRQRYGSLKIKQEILELVRQWKGEETEDEAGIGDSLREETSGVSGS